MRSLNLVFNCSQWGGGGRFVCCRVILRGCVALLPAFPVDLRCPGCSVVEYPGKVACPSGRRCSTRNAVWCHSHPGFKSQRYRHRRPAPMGPGGFVMPGWCGRVRVCACGPSGVSGAACVFGPGCLVCPWAAARPRAVRAASLRPGTSARSPAMPCRRPRAPQPGPAATHGHLSLAPLSSSNFARNSPVAYSNIEFVSLELQRFRAVSKSDRGELCAKFVWRWPCERVLAQPTGRSLHRGRVLWFLRCLPLHTCGAWSVVVLASSISASRSVQNSPCSVFC